MTFLYTQKYLHLRQEIHYLLSAADIQLYAAACSVQTDSSQALCQAVL